MINLQKTTTTSNNGQVFRSYDIDGVLHGAELIPELIPLVIHDLEANRVKEFDLSKFTQTDLMAVSFRADFKGDDEAGFNFRDRYGGQLIVRVLDQNRIIEQIIVSISSYPAIQINPLILDRRYTYLVYPSIALHKLTFYCKPVSLLEAIDVVIPNRDADVNDNRNNRRS